MPIAIRHLVTRRFFASHQTAPAARVTLQSGQVFDGRSFGAPVSVSGEVVFTTSLVGYTESMTDPSYRGQILTFTQPLIGNYGVPSDERDSYGLMKNWESDRIQVQGIIVSDYAAQYSHWNAVESLADWCRRFNVPAITGVDTRALTQVLRDQGSTLGQLTVGDQSPAAFHDPNSRDLVAEVSTAKPVVYNPNGALKIALIDCGAKHNIVRYLADLGAQVHVLPFDADISNDASFDGIFISNGPGDPAHCQKTVENLRKLIQQDRPIFGICMGNLLLGAAAGMSTYKLRFGNRAHNQPAINQLTGGAVMTSQNHGYALDLERVSAETKRDWQAFYVNLHDQSNEGIRHAQKPFSSVQFHPEAKGGPEDTMHLFHDFVQQVRQYKQQSVRT